MKKYLFLFLITCYTNTYAQKCLTASNKELYRLYDKELPDVGENEKILIKTCACDVFEVFNKDAFDSLFLIKKGGWSEWREVVSPVSLESYFINLTEKNQIKLLKKQLKRRGLYNGRLNGKMNLKLWSVIRAFMLTYDSQSMISNLVPYISNTIFYPKTLISKKTYNIIMNSCYDEK